MVVEAMVVLAAAETVTDCFFLSVEVKAAGCITAAFGLALVLLCSVSFGDLVNYVDFVDQGYCFGKA